MKPLPWWFWSVPLVAIAVWWPIAPYFASDDFLAMHYAREFGNVAQDFVGPQYAATDVWSFYRPLITLSFWVDQLLGGAWPPTGHFSNVLAHAASSLLVALIWRRFLPDGNAALAGMLWAMMPGHVGSIAWVVGRVDSHTTVWCLLALLLCLRANDRRRAGRPGRRWPSVLALGLALMSKELAFVVPPLMTLLSAAQLRSVRAVWHASSPAWLLFALYVPFRLLVLGRFGGYEASRYDALPIVQGLGTVLLDLGVPLRWIGTPDGALFLWSAGVPVAIAVLLAAWRRPRTTLVTTLALLVSIAPMAAFLPACENPHNLRYYYLPTVALVGLLTAGNRWLVAAIAIAWLWPLVAVRSAQVAADTETAAMHRELLDRSRTAPPGPMFVDGMPNKNATRTAMQLHFGIDRLLQPPFTDEPRPLFAWRPMLDAPGAVRLSMPGQPAFALPAGSTWSFDAQRGLQPAGPAPALPELVVADDVDGVLDISTERLQLWTERYQQMIVDGGDSFGLRTPGVQPAAFRLTMFTGSGYLSCLCPNHAREDATAGRIDVARMLGGDRTRRFGPVAEMPAAQVVVLPGGLKIGDALVVPTTIDLVPEFPTLIEAGTFDFATLRFTPTHRARRFVHFRFDRKYAGWVRAVQGR